MEKTYGANNPTLGTSLAALRYVELARGKPAALPPLERARALPTSSPRQRANVAFALARALRGTKTDPKRARALATEAQKLLADHKAIGVPPKDPDLLSMRAAIAKFLRSR